MRCSTWLVKCRYFSLFLFCPIGLYFDNFGYRNCLQGWRKSMEDAHIAWPDLEIKVPAGDGSTETKLVSMFGVFDGHGGKWHIT
jgi:hypothetical protein